MIFKLHYFLLTAGASAFSILLGVFIETYTDASPAELGALLMVTPFLAMIARPLLCSMADREQAHRKYLLLCLGAKTVSYLPFVVIPFLGETIYRRHSRACWYFLAILKIVGDVAVGGICSIGDSLAINYANRVGTSFSVYRVWGTISWMLFGLVIGQINEVPFLPKYVPGFMILIGSLALYMFLIWLWPKEYFIMCTNEQSEAVVHAEQDTNSIKSISLKDKSRKQDNKVSSCLMPREVVWAHAKNQLLGLSLCGFKRKKSQDDSFGRSMDKVDDVTTKDKAKDTSINKMTQLRILTVLVKRDCRIILYLIYFAFAGGSFASMSFFFISLSNICHTQLTCDFSQLAGFLQFSMAALETVLFFYIQAIMKKIGRLNIATIATFLITGKFLFYGIYWINVSPYYSLVAESITGITYAINLTLMVEVGHLFASEVEFIIPELMDRNIISADTETKKLKYSLAATMQALVSSSSEGIGNGFGSLIYGILLEKISYEDLWLIIGIASSICCVVLIVVNLIDVIFNLRLGLDVRAAAMIEKNKEFKDKEIGSNVINHEPVSGETNETMISQL